MISKLTPSGKFRRFAGPDYDPAKDNERLDGQMKRVFILMGDGAWRTLREIAQQTGDPEASISAQLRHLRKPRFGAYRVEKKSRGHGLFSYRLLPPVPVASSQLGLGL